jgi:hypothetical protein
VVRHEVRTRRRDERCQLRGSGRRNWRMRSLRLSSEFDSY